jgi:hypothetical protein
VRLTFVATATGPHPHQIEGETINGFDFSGLDHGGQYVPTDATLEAGIRAAHRDADGILHVTLTERCIAGRYPARGAHWRGSGQEIDAADYDPSVCHIVPTGMAGLIEGVDFLIVWGENTAPLESGWTVEPIEQEAQESDV